MKGEVAWSLPCARGRQGVYAEPLLQRGVKPHCAAAAWLRKRMRGRLGSFLCSPNAHTRNGHRMWMVICCFERWISRMALSFLGSANLVRPGRRPNGPSNTAYPSPYGDQNARPCIQRKSQRCHIRIHMDRKNKRAWREHLRLCSLGRALVPGKRLQSNRWVGG